MCQNSVFAKFWVIRNEVFEKKIAFFCFFLFLCWKIETEKRKKQKRENSKKTYKNKIFWGGHAKMWKIKKNFSKNCLTLFVLGTEKKTCIFVATICFGQNFFGPKQCKTRSTIKIVVSTEIAQNQKWHLFWENGVFWHGWKSGFTNCVFQKLCFLKTLFL